MKKIFLAIAALLCSISLMAQEPEATVQTRWTNPVDAGAEIHGQGWKELNGTYYRLPDRAEGLVREPVWWLSRCSAGLSIVFRTNAEDIQVRYKVGGDLNMFHMPSMGVSGVDLYAVDKKGRCLWCAPDFTPSFGEVINFHYSDLFYAKRNKTYEYHLYLPLYNNVEWLQIGVPETAELTFVPVSKDAPVVIYGTSITQGACATRTGNAWTNIIERHLQRPVVNLGFSGNALMEPEVFSLMSEIPATVYVIDCLPNMMPTDKIADKMKAGVDIIRKVSNRPIIFVEHSGYSNEYTTHARDYYKQDNADLKAGFKSLQKAGYTNLFYVTHKDLNIDSDCQVEGVHLNDLGMHRQASAVENAIKKSEKQYKAPKDSKKK